MTGIHRSSKKHAGRNTEMSPTLSPSHEDAREEKAHCRFYCQKRSGMLQPVARDSSLLRSHTPSIRPTGC